MHQNINKTLLHLRKRKLTDDEWVYVIEKKRRWLSHYLKEVEPQKICDLPMVMDSGGRCKQLGFDHQSRLENCLQGGPGSLCWPIDEHRHFVNKPGSEDGTAYFIVLDSQGWILVTADIRVVKEGSTNKYEKIVRVRLEPWSSVLEISKTTGIPITWFWHKLNELTLKIFRKSAERHESITKLRSTAEMEEAIVEALTMVGDPES